MEEKNGTLYIFSNRRLRLRKDGTGAFRSGSGEARIYEFKGAERDAAEGRIGAGRVGFLGCYLDCLSATAAGVGSGRSARFAGVEGDLVEENYNNLA